MPLLFAATLFVSAFLLFLVQPMVGKMVLPLLGGTPAVWNTCMVFFQAALLAGYAYTHTVSTHLPTRRQLLLQGGLLALPFLFLPFAVGSWQPPTEANPVFAVLGLLAVLVGIPFFVVATSAPLLQKWFAATGHPSSKDPYFLYGASNLGSMLALLAYPALIEPLFPVASQSWFWTGAYLLFIGLTVTCAAVVWRAPPVALVPGGGEAPPPAEPPLPALTPPPSTAIRTSRKRGKGRAVVAPAPVPRPAKPARPAPPAAEVTALRRLRWIGLAAVPSSLMLGVTTYLTTDIAAIPLFWIIPLALYLLTFILVFMRWPVEWLRRPHAVVLGLQPLALALLILFELTPMHVPQSVAFFLHLTAFFLTALLCHGELARDRPSTRHLTEFYLCMSVGGVLGGLLNGLVAPLVFNRLVEYMLVLALSCLLRPPVNLVAAFTPRDGRERPRPSTLEDYLLDIGYALCLGLLTYALLRIGVARNLWGDKGSLATALAHLITEKETPTGAAADVGIWAGTLLVTGIPLGVCLVFAGRPLRFGLCACTFFLANAVYVVGLKPFGLELLRGTDDTLYVHRNFYGVIRVRADDTDSGERQHTLIHGGIDHGRQYVNFPRRLDPITYFHPNGPIGRIFTAFSKQHEQQTEKLPYAVVGLGIGTLAAYGQKGQEVHFYEIDPAVRDLSLPPEGAETYFFYLKDALDKKVKVDVRMGDGRLVLKKKAQDRQYHIIVLDAFSSDAIPVHLLTLQALDLYLSKLADGGVLIFNITNRYVDLRQPLANLAGQRGLRCLYGGDHYRRTQPDRFAADWVVMVKPQSAEARAADAARLFGAAPAGGGLTALPWAGLADRALLDLPPWMRQLVLGSALTAPTNPKLIDVQDDLRTLVSNGGWVQLLPNDDRIWTDDYSNLLSVLSL